jgi:hypothetical protein
MTKEELKEIVEDCRYYARMSSMTSDLYSDEERDYNLIERFFGVISDALNN